MNRRLELHKVLCSILGCPDNGSDCRAYFQPPTKPKYPCIIYSIDSMNNEFANNSVYQVDRRYSLTVIDSRHDSPIADKIIRLPTCSFNRSYVSDNLYHTTFTIYVKGGNSK